MAIYHITTKQRTYNSVDSIAQFHIMRQNCKDQSPVISAFRWQDQQWMKVDAMPFEYNEQAFEDRAWWSFFTFAHDKQLLAIDIYNAKLVTDWQLWEALSNFHSPFTYSEAAQVYSALGLEPFAGYPLKRSV